MATPKSDQLRALREAQYEQRVKRSAHTASPATAPTTAVINVINSARKSVADRQAKWRADHPELNRKRARDGMRKLRTKKD